MIDRSVLARAYELKMTTDLTVAEIERALIIRRGTLKSHFMKIFGLGIDLSRKTTSEIIFGSLNKNGPMRRDEIINSLDATAASIKVSLRKLVAEGKVKQDRCRVDRRRITYRVAKWIV